MKTYIKKIHIKLIMTIFVPLLYLMFQFSAMTDTFKQSTAVAENCEKHECLATVDDSFAENQIVVTMKDSAEPVKYYTVADFSELSLTVLEDLTKSVKDILKK